MASYALNFNQIKRRFFHVTLKDYDIKCLIFIDEKFAQTIDLEYLYDVFLTKYGPGDCYVSERTPSYFVVKGTKNLKFAWEVKTIQRDYENLRLEAHTREKDDTDYIYDVSAYMNTLLYQLD